MRALLFIDIKKKSKPTPKFVLQKLYAGILCIQKGNYFNFIKKLSFSHDLFKYSTNT